MTHFQPPYPTICSPPSPPPPHGRRLGFVLCVCVCVCWQNQEGRKAFLSAGPKTLREGVEHVFPFDSSNPVLLPNRLFFSSPDHWRNPIARIFPALLMDPPSSCQATHTCEPEHASKARARGLPLFGREKPFSHLMPSISDKRRAIDQSTISFTFLTTTLGVGYELDI